MLLPSFTSILLMLSGVKVPAVERDDGGKVAAEPFAAEVGGPRAGLCACADGPRWQAKAYTELRLLQQNVKVMLEGLNNQTFVGTVLHPNGNIAEALLRVGLARCADWSILLVTQGRERLRAAERLVGAPLLVHPAGGGVDLPATYDPSSGRRQRGQGEPRWHLEGL